MVSSVLCTDSIDFAHHHRNNIHLKLHSKIHFDLRVEIKQKKFIIFRILLNDKIGTILETDNFSKTFLQIQKIAYLPKIYILHVENRRMGKKYSFEQIVIVQFRVSLIWKILEFLKSMILFLKFWLKIFGKLVSDLL